MFVEREKRAEIVRVEHGQQQRRRRAIAGTFPRSDRRLQRRAAQILMCKLASQIIATSADEQRLSLCQRIGDQ